MSKLKFLSTVLVAVTQNSSFEVFFAQQNAFDHNTGWGGAGWEPNGGYYVGGECGQDRMLENFSEF